MNRLTRNILGFLLGVVLAVAAVSAFASNPTIEAVHRMVERNENGQIVGVCSAVMIQPERALTAGHCVLAMESPQIEINGKSYPVMEAYLRTDRDLAVLIIPNAPCPCVVVGTTPVADGDAVFIVGFPGLDPKTASLGLVLGRFFLEDKEFVATTADSRPGMSGGAVFNANDELVGVNSLGLLVGRGSGFTEYLGVIIPADTE